MYEYYYDDYLMHHGVKGMKWGVRKYRNADGSLTAAGKAKQDYKVARKQYRKAERAKNRVGSFAVGRAGIARYEEARKNANDAYVNSINAKAKLNAAKASTKEKAERAEYKTYRNAMRSTGLRGSFADDQSGGKTTALYDNVKAKKGQEYADRMEKANEKVYFSTLAGAAVVYAGSIAALAYLENR